MTPLGEALVALVPMADPDRHKHSAIVEARGVLRKHAPCEVCNGTGDIHDQHCEDEDCGQDELCFLCFGAGWTAASVDAACARDNDLDRAARDNLDELERLRREVAILHKERAACWDALGDYDAPAEHATLADAVRATARQAKEFRDASRGAKE